MTHRGASPKRLIALTVRAHEETKHRALSSLSPCRGRSAATKVDYRPPRAKDRICSIAVLGPPLIPRMIPSPSIRK